MYASTRDHPRVCGEHLDLYVNPLLSLGSSPRMRGTHWLDGFANVESGIIPAYAGNTHIMVGYLAGTEDHPRVCGEHSWSRNF